MIHSKKTDANKIQADWTQWLHRPSEAEINLAAWLAWEGLLTSVECMDIRKNRITNIPRDQMDVTRVVYIDNLNNTNQLGSILASVKWCG